MTAVSIHDGQRALWQPILVGKTITAVPLKESDYDVLYSVASDPKIWEMHPESDRYTRAKFDVYFRSRMDSKGALLVSDGKSGEVIGSSRFSEHNTLTGTVEIGGTFLKCLRWGTGANRELKTLMLAFAFGNVDQVEFLVGIHNFRSQAAMTKIGGKIIRTITEDEPEFVYAITKSEFLDGQLIER